MDSLPAELPGDLKLGTVFIVLFSQVLFLVILEINFREQVENFLNAGNILLRYNTHTVKLQAICMA